MSANEAITQVWREAFPQASTSDDPVRSPMAVAHRVPMSRRPGHQARGDSNESPEDDRPGAQVR